MPRTPTPRRRTSTGTSGTTPTRKSSGKRKRAVDDVDDVDVDVAPAAAAAPPSSSTPNKRQKIDRAKDIMGDEEYRKYRSQDNASKWATTQKQRDECAKEAAAMLARAEARYQKEANKAAAKAQKKAATAASSASATAGRASTTTSTTTTAARAKARVTSSAPAAATRASAAPADTTTSSPSSSSFPNLSKAEEIQLKQLRNTAKYSNIQKQKDDAKRELAALEQKLAARSATTTTTTTTTPRRSTMTTSSARKPTASSGSRRSSTGNADIIRPPSSYQQRRFSNPFNSPIPAAATNSGADSTNIPPAPPMPDFPAAAAAFHHRHVDEEDEPREPLVPVAIEEEEEQHAQYHQRYVDNGDEQAPQASSEAWFWAWASFFAVALASYFLGTTFNDQGFRVKPASVQCYQNTPTDNDEGHPMTVELCRDVPVSLWKPCPKDAICVGGAIEQCGRHLTLNATTGTSCVLSDHAKETIQSMKNLLHAWTVDDACQPDGTPYAIGKRIVGDSSVPLFYYTQLIGELESGFDISLLDIANEYSDQAKPVFVWDRQSDGNIRIGLHPAQGLKLSPQCNVKRFLRFIERGITNTVIAIMSWMFASCMITLAGLVETPLLSCIGSVIGLIVVLVWKRKRAERERQYIQHQARKVRACVDHMLQSDRQPLPILYVRDAILRNENMPYGATPANEKRFINDIWPVVTSNISRDNRVRKEKMSEPPNNVVRDTWQWKEMAPSSAVNAQAATGTNHVHFHNG